MSERKWMCLRCVEEHDIIDGVVQCHASSRAPMTELEAELFTKWAQEDLPKIDTKIKISDD